MACVCGPGLMGDGLTCTERPVFETNDLPADVASGQCVHTLRGHNDEILDVCYNSTGSKLSTHLFSS